MDLFLAAFVIYLIWRQDENRDIFAGLAIGVLLAVYFIFMLL